MVRDAFAVLGHDAWSCDILPRPGNHIRGDVREVLGDGWDLMVAHPPCTYLCSMGAWWNHKRPERWVQTEAALEFVQVLLDAPIAKIGLENPVGIISTRIRKPDQVIQPWQYGHEANKPTCLWLKNLPPLKPTRIVGRGEFYVKANGKRAAKWSHLLSGRSHKRARVASRTFPGIARAMAEQWGGQATRSPDPALATTTGAFP